MPVKKHALARFPQFLSDRFTLSAANTFTTEVIFSPLPRFPFNLKSGETTAIEILWIDTFIGTTDFNVAGDQFIFSFSLGAPPTFTAQLQAPLTIIAGGRLTSGVATATGTAIAIVNQRERFDLTDREGNGFLMAASRFNVSGTSLGQAAANTLDWRMYYRFVIVDAVDLMGVLQNQVPV